MRSQTLQVAVIVALGACVGLLISRPWQPSEAPAAPAVTSPEPAATVQISTLAGTDPTPPPTRTFKLPTLASAPAVEAAPPKEKASAAKAAPPAPLFVPKDWLLRGAGPQNYDVRSERNEVLAGQASVLMAAKDKDIARTQSASLMQTASAAPWIGKRIEFSVNVKAGRLQEWDVWVRAIDAGNVVIAYDESQVAASKIEWRKGAATIDVPWSAAEIAYGIKVYGPSRLYVDDTHLTVLDKSLPAPMRNRPDKLGVVAQDASKNGALGMPSNLDFEDIVPADETFRELPQERLDRARF